jgi:hypothetical protein
VLIVLRVTRDLLQTFAANPPEFDPGHVHTSSLRTLGRCVKDYRAAYRKG